MSAQHSTARTRSILLVRHGQAEHMVNGLTGGWTDTDLTKLGCRQARLLASRLKHELAGISCHLYCSDLKRALQTAEIIGHELGLVPVPDSGLRMISHGIATGKSREEAKQYYVEPAPPYLDWQPYPQAETWRQLHTRAASCMDRLTEGQHDLLLLITHGATISCIVSWWLQLDIERHDAYFETLPASLSALTTEPWGGRKIERLNDTAHLYAAGISERMRL